MNLDSHTREVFFTVLAEKNDYAIAAQAAGLTVRQVEYLYSKDEHFALDWDRAVTTAIARLKEIAYDRAVNGVPKPVIRKGEIVGWEKVPDNRMLMRLLEAEFPEKYDPKRDTNADGSALTLVVVQFGSKEAQVNTPDNPNHKVIDIGSDTAEGTEEQSTDAASNDEPKPVTVQRTFAPPTGNEGIPLHRNVPLPNP